MLLLKTVETVELAKLEQPFYFNKKVNFHYMPPFEQKQEVGINDLCGSFQFGLLDGSARREKG